MDNLTHTLVGVALARAGLSRRVGRGTTLLLVVSSNIPDLDVLLAVTGLEDAHLQRRLYTHCILGAPLLAALLAVLWRRWRPEVAWRTWFALALLGAGLHVFLDLWNSYGVVALWPFTRERFELAWVFIIDLALWALLAFPVFAQLVAAGRRHAERLYQVTVVAVTLYVTACALLHWRAEVLLGRAVSAAGGRPTFTHVFPEALGPHRWRGVAREGDTYGVWLLQPLSGAARLMDEVRTEASHPEVAAVRRTDRARRLEWFFKAPVWRRDAETGQLEVYDLRFRSLVLAGRGSPFGVAFAPAESEPPDLP